MLKYLPLLGANLKRKPLRSALTLASIIVAFLLFGLLTALRTALTGVTGPAGADRLMTIHKVSLIQSLPGSYIERIRGVKGIKVACSHDWFGGIYKEDRNQIVAVAVDVPTFFATYPEYLLSEQQKQSWYSDRTSAIVSRRLAELYGWKVGDTVPIRSGIYTKEDGSSTWEMKIAGIVTTDKGASDPNSLWFHYEYFNEARTEGKDSIGWVVSRVDDPNRAQEIARSIDVLFANSSTETKTSLEKQFAQGFANQMGNIGAIVSAVVAIVFFTMLLITGNTMAQSVRERTTEIAVMKTLGFSSPTVTSLVMAEALLTTAIGGFAGLFLATLAAPHLAAGMLAQYMAEMRVGSGALVVGAVLAFTLGALSGALPSYQAWRLNITDALRRG